MNGPTCQSGLAKLTFSLSLTLCFAENQVEENIFKIPANNSKLCSSATDQTGDASSSRIPFSKKPNVGYGLAIFHAVMMEAAVFGTSYLDMP